MRICCSMDKKTIITSFLDHGLLISPAALEAVTDEAMPELMAAAKRQHHIVVQPLSSTGLAITTNKKEKPALLSPQTTLAYYTTKYTRLQSLLAQKLHPTSIINAKAAASPLTVIGMVRDSTTQGFALEDLTGTIDVVSTKRPDNNDVVGVVGAVRESTLFEQELHYPDIPVLRPVGCLPHTAATFSTTPIEGELVITPEEVRAHNDRYPLPQPGAVTLTRGQETVRILIYRSSATGEQAVRYLKKRHLSPSPAAITSEDDPFVIDPIPDIFWVVSHRHFHAIYKGVTVFSLGEHQRAVVDLSTMAVEFS